MIFILQMRETEAWLTSQSKWVEPEVTPGLSDLKALELSHYLRPVPDSAMRVRSPRGGDL